MNSHLQDAVDNYYLSQGKRPCCAGCDHWRFYNSTVGECTKSAPVSHDERFSLIDIQSSSARGDAGHILTKRGHSCGDFLDTYDWESHNK